MNLELQKRCDLFVKNRDTIAKAFKWDNNSLMLAGSSFYVGLDLEADGEKLRACEEILKKKAGSFSEYRGNLKMPVLCKMAIMEDPAQYIDDLNNIIAYMKKIKWIDEQHKILAAMTIYDHTSPSEAEAVVDKMADLYQGMKKNHPWITSSEDIPFAAMLASSGLDSEALLVEMEECYKLLSETFKDKDAAQSLSHVVALDEKDTAEKCQKISGIFNLLKEKKHKYGTSKELAVLGTMSMLEITAEEAADEIIAADEYLKGIKGFGNFDMDENVRRMYAALLVMDTYMPPAVRSHESALNSSVALAVAMEVCVMMILTSACVATLL